MKPDIMGSVILAVATILASIIGPIIIISPQFISYDQLFHSSKLSNSQNSEQNIKIGTIAGTMITSLDMPKTIRATKTIEITATAENRGSVSDTTTLELKVNGNPEGIEDLTVGAGETGSVTFEYTPEDPGLYTVEVSGIQRTLTVKEKSKLGLIAGILMLFFAIGGGAYLYSTGRLDEILWTINNR